jgi:butyrate kinase
LSGESKPFIFVINPGSTSTKVGLYSETQQIMMENLYHDRSVLSACPQLWDQFEFRLTVILDFLSSHAVANLDAVVGRGGLLKPVKRGTFLIDQKMIQDATQGIQGEHVANLGVALAFDVAAKFNCPAYTVDPVSVDEFEEVARISGHPLIQRHSLAHALNLRAAAIKAARQAGIDIDRSHFIVAHLGGGISIAPVKQGRVIDVNDASSSGPFSPERSGDLPLQQFIDLCFSGQYTKEQIKRMVMGEGGLVAYLGTNDLKQVESRIDQGDEYAHFIFNAMVYQIAKEIGAMATVLLGRVDGIVFTGGLACSQRLIQDITQRVQFIAPIFLFPGELEMEAMACGVLRILRGEEILQVY